MMPFLERGVAVGLMQDAQVSTTPEKPTTTESAGCSSNSVTKTDEVGDKVMKMKTDC